MLALAPVLGYGSAWIGHFFVEGNVPAAFGHPLWSLRADMRMWTKIVAGTMDAEVERVMADAQAADAASAEDEAHGSNGAGERRSDDLEELRNRTVN